MKRFTSRQTDSFSNMSKTIDVLIPTYKPGKEFVELVQLLQKQTIEIHKIIIMNTEQVYWERLSFENPILNSQSKLEVHHVSVNEFDHGGTRHQGMLRSQADICICMTQDAVPADEHMIEHLIEPFKDEKVVVSYARQLPKTNAGPIEQYTRSFNYPQEPRKKSLEDVQTMGIKAFFCSDVCAAYDRERYLSLGGFIRHTIFNEDMIFASGALRAGYHIYYAAEAKVLHSHEYCFMQQLRRNFDLGVSQADHPEVFAGISSEKEGKRMVLATCRYLIDIGKPFGIAKVIWQSGAKYIGYFLGTRYHRLPKKLIQYLTMSKAYWK